MSLGRDWFIEQSQAIQWGRGDSSTRYAYSCSPRTSSNTCNKNYTGHDPALDPALDPDPDLDIDLDLDNDHDPDPDPDHDLDIDIDHDQ